MFHDDIFDQTATNIRFRRSEAVAAHLSPYLWTGRRQRELRLDAGARTKSAKQAGGFSLPKGGCKSGRLRGCHLVLPPGSFFPEKAAGLSLLPQDFPNNPKLGRPATCSHTSASGGWHYLRWHSPRIFAGGTEIRGTIRLAANPHGRGGLSFSPAYHFPFVALHRRTQATLWCDANKNRDSASTGAFSLPSPGKSGCT